MLASLQVFTSLHSIVFNHAKLWLINSVSAVSGLSLIFMRNISPERNVVGRLTVLRTLQAENSEGAKIGRYSYIRV